MAPRRFLVLIVLLSVVTTLVSAQVFRIGSVAPENSPWGRSLNRLAAEWQRISNGRVRVQVFHGGVAGDEADMVRKMRIGQLQAVVLTNSGMSAFSESVMTLSMPLLIRSQDEYDYVFDHVRGELEAQIEDDGFRVLSWSTAGWLYFFSKTEMRTPADLRTMKLAASPEEMSLVRAYQLMGYQGIAISYTERLAALANGMVNSYLTVPLLAAAFQWFGMTPYMLDMKIGPAPGGVLMSERAYRQLPADVRDQLMDSAHSLAAGLNDDILDLESQAIGTMKQYGLHVVEPTDAERQAWIEDITRSSEVTLGLVFDAHIHDEIQGLLDEYRSSK